MSEHDPDDDRDRDARGRPGDRPPGGIVHLGIDVGVSSLDDLLGGLVDVGAVRGGQDGEWQWVDEPADRDRIGSDPTDSPGRTDEPFADEPVDVADEFLVETHRADDQLIVTAELPGVGEDDLSVGIDVPSNELVIAAEGRTIERVSLPWASTDAARVWFNNGVLEVRLRPGGDGGGAGD